MSGRFQPAFIRFLMISWMAGTVNAKVMCSHSLVLSMSQNMPCGLKYISAINWRFTFTKPSAVLKCSLDIGFKCNFEQMLEPMGFIMKQNSDCLGA
jgi:hypothetical protein